MKLTISGKEYELPEFSAADFDDWRTEIEIVNASKDRTYPEVQDASIKVIVGFLQASFPELTDERAIKKAIPAQESHPDFWRAVVRKNRCRSTVATFLIYA